MTNTKDDQIKETSETSQTTGSSTGGSTTRSTRGSRLGTRAGGISKPWSEEEMKKLESLEMRMEIFRKYYRAKTLNEVAFFNKNFPNRTPQAVYMRAYYLHKKLC